MRLMRRAGFWLVRGLMLLCLPLTDMAAAGPQWESRARVPSNRTEVAVAELDGKIYLMGGYKYYGIVVSRAVEAYDPQADQWEEKASLPQGRHHPAAAAVNGKLYFIGGFTPMWNWHTLTKWEDNPAGDVWEYDPNQNRWRARAPMPTARGALAVGVIDGKIYAVGGKRDSRRDREGKQEGKILNTLEVYDPATDTWQTLPPMPTPRDHLAAAVLDGRLYAIGGRYGSIGNSMAVNEMFDPNTRRWIPKAPMPSPRSGIAAAALGHRIYIFGGEDKKETGYVTFNLTESYDPDTDQWTTHDPMAHARHGLGAALLDGRVYVIAGGPVSASARGDNANEVFTPPSEKP
jgi:N-acetylneuraminic acid mutarotase